MLCAGGTYLAGTISARGRDRSGKVSKKITRRLGGRHAYGKAGEARRAEQRYARFRPSRQYQCERPWPECLCQDLRSCVEVDVGKKGFCIRVVANERIETGAALGREDSSNSRIVGRIGSQAIDGLGGEGYETAIAQDGNRFVDGLAIELEREFGSNPSWRAAVSCQPWSSSARKEPPS